MKKTLHLVCNAHIDPVWLWNWQEGLAETLSTFRTAAGFCDEFESFVFCHGESLLYEWVEEFEPELFARVQELVKAGRWHIMGGWYVQPDCNMPSGESFVRQILTGKNYFREKFGTEPRTAINFDPFGHSRGLVQILKKSGYTSYLFCRPDEKWLRLPADDFVWKGYDGSEIIAHRAGDHYNSELGKAAHKIETWLSMNQTKSSGLLLWGIGNHGGGPSRRDLDAIEKKMRNEETGNVFGIRHSTPEEYFDTLDKDDLPVFSGGLNPWAVGCYTSMAKVKQMHRRLESQYFTTENMLAIAALQGIMDYPKTELNTALKDLLFCQFHDILPGTSISEVEEFTLQKMSHALEILTQLQTKAFFVFLSGMTPAGDGEFPIIVYNHHPFDYEAIIAIELQPPEPNPDTDTFLMPEVFDVQGNKIIIQLEKESSNIINDHRKYIIFKAKLSASSMNRFSCYLRKIDIDLKPKIQQPIIKQPKSLNFNNGLMEVEINQDTGLIDKYNIGDTNYLLPDALRLLVIRDNPDPWGMQVSSFRDVIGEFTLMSKTESAEFAGVGLSELEPVRVIEDGPVRTIVEALFKYNHSTGHIRYAIPKSGTEFEVEIKIYMMEKDRMIKLSVPSRFAGGNCCGQVACGVEQFGNSGNEHIAQKWVAISDQENTLTIINDSTHGFDYQNGELRLSLLRTPAYSAHPVEGKSRIVSPDRFEPRMDQGERNFRFWLNAGPCDDRLDNINREAKLHNEPLMTLCCFPRGQSEILKSGVKLSNDIIDLSALKMSEDGKYLIIRLFEPTGKRREVRVTVPVMDLSFNVYLDKFELKTIAIDIESKSICETDLLERKQNGLESCCTKKDRSICISCRDRRIRVLLSKIAAREFCIWRN